jgi:hypothetical protein
MKLTSFSHRARLLALVAIAALAALFACGAGGFDPASKVDSVRLFVVRADKPYVKPGETVTLEARPATAAAKPGALASFRSGRSPTRERLTAASTAAPAPRAAVARSRASPRASISRRSSRRGRRSRSRCPKTR